MFFRKIVPTADGSSTIFIPEWNESYHSRHGAVQEAYYVFIRNGLDLIKKEKNQISILEIGFGTGLNALITLCESIQEKLKIHYTGIEKYPLSEKEILTLNYPESLKSFNNALTLDENELAKFYRDLMYADWGVNNSLAPDFQLNKVRADFMDFEYPQEKFDLIYFDAFGARVQPELWTEVLFEKLFKCLKPEGILTTYSSKGSVRRALVSVGFKAEKRLGPPGKREMLIAIKK